MLHSGKLVGCDSQPPSLLDNTNLHGWSADSEEGVLSWTYKSTEDWSILTAAPHETSFVLDPSTPGGVISTLSLISFQSCKWKRASITCAERGFRGDRLPLYLEQRGTGGKRMANPQFFPDSLGAKPCRFVDYDSVTADGSGTDAITLQSIELSSACTPMTCDGNACDDGITTLGKCVWKALFRDTLPRHMFPHWRGLSGQDPLYLASL